MTEKQLKQVAIQKAVMDVMEKHIAMWQSVTALRGKYDQFVRNLKKIADFESHIQTDLAPLKARKKESKNGLVEKVFPVTSVLSVYAFDRKDGKLGKLVNVKFSNLEKMKVGALEKYCLKILKIAGAFLEKKEESDKRLLYSYPLRPKLKKEEIRGRKPSKEEPPFQIGDNGKNIL